MDLFTENAFYFWLIFGFALLGIELLLPGILLLFFGAGALLTALICYFYVPHFWVQWLIFIVFSVTFLMIFKKRIYGGLKKGNVKETIEHSTIQIIGKKVKVIEAISPEKSGLVELDGTIWEAVSPTSSFQKNDIVKIIKRESLTLFVE